MKCARCKKTVDKVTEVLWTRGPNGYRKYKICEKCLPEVKKDNETKVNIKF